MGELRGLVISNPPGDYKTPFFMRMDELQIQMTMWNFICANVGIGNPKITIFNMTMKGFHLWFEKAKCSDSAQTDDVYTLNAFELAGFSFRESIAGYSSVKDYRRKKAEEKKEKLKAAELKKKGLSPSKKTKEQSAAIEDPENPATEAEAPSGYQWDVRNVFFQGFHLHPTDMICDVSLLDHDQPGLVSKRMEAGKDVGIFANSVVVEGNEFPEPKPGEEGIGTTDVALVIAKSFISKANKTQILYELGAAETSTFS